MMMWCSKIIIIIIIYMILKSVVLLNISAETDTFLQDSLFVIL